ncbi:hypothetical protein ACL9RI_16835 [Janthinobacterium sp. Mn2066]|uniref:hypothetical protein n=1 Tax=Janthinobacterium sp. Mn2066 TaxID=3395264 RepID=UPI003BC7525A
MENDKTGSKRIWLSFIGGGMLATTLGFCALDLSPSPATAPAFGIMLLLTGGLFSCMAGAIGLAGMLAWIPGMAEIDKGPELSQRYVRQRTVRKAFKADNPS